MGRMFEILAEALDPFIAEVLEPQIGDSDWALVVKLADEEKGITGKAYSREDPSVQLRMLTEGLTGRVKKGWYPFKGTVTREHEAYASLLRETRNQWAHNASFDDDAALRALDYARLLLASVGQVYAADKVDAIRLDLRRIATGKQDTRALKSSTVVPGASGLAPWRQVLKPRNEVATGSFQSSEFAADLYKVAHNPAATSGEYSDPTQFFARTYLTEGLRDLISRAVKRLAGDANASPVVNLQTNFGGGKSHSMLVLWHLAGGLPLNRFPQEAQELLAANGYPTEGITAGRVALVGNHFAPQGETKDDGTRVNTLWGELAWQLGGREAYNIVREHDEKRTNPGGDLHVLLSRYAPAVILIDEWVAYARQLYGREDLAGGTFDTQFTFAQSLTEATKSIPGVMLAISIPASHDGDRSGEVPGAAEEVGGSNGLDALNRLQNVVRRVADQWRPASSDEAYRIVKQRLFESEDAPALAQIAATAKAFTDFYQANATEFPKEARDPHYGRRIQQTYPLHPELFDRLYEDWSSLERFQRTRGVLRLMNAVIHALWIGEDQGPLILPGSIPLSVASVNAELTQYLQDSWKAVIDADVDGANSEPARIDSDKPVLGQRSVTRRLARTVFFGAAPTIGTAHKGIDTQRVFIGTAVPGDVVGNFHSALGQLGDRTTYYYSSAGKHWYDTQANITRRAKDAADALHPEDVWAEIVKRLRGEERTRSDFAGVHVGPTDSGDIPDTDQARLVILHPRYPHRRRKTDSPARIFAQQATERRGTANRANRNMNVFLAPDEERLAELDQATRSFLAWKEIAEKSNELNLTPQQLAQATDKRDQFGRTVTDRLALTYQWVLNPVAPDPGSPFELEEVKADGQTGSLAERVAKKLGNAGAYSTQHAARSIRLALDTKVPAAWSSGHVAIGDLWSLYAQYPYMPRLRSRDVLIDAIDNQPLLWQTESFALADRYDETTGRYSGLWLPGDTGRAPVTDATLIVTPALAEAQRVEDTAAIAGSGMDESNADASISGAAPSAVPGNATTVLPTKRTVVTRYVGSAPISAERYSADFAKIATEVLAHLAASGANMTISLSIDAIHTDGFSEQQLRTVRENATTLKFTTNEFETD
ncbi:Swt1 family HEPN domain-containing protein [Rathayibacter sp. AY1C9]|uniref:Swt1 family HEPN domain-containing protein n=1 Tax=Rathayibacter sp. AY1C9 TaxID=2080541 RepID=UPI002157CC78|nr:Swt1 family HEPN domain-containing protein [Rathayibacter sp. AY1C9]